MKARFNFEIPARTPAGSYLITEMSRNGGTFQTCQQQGPFESEEAAKMAGDAFAAKANSSVVWSPRGDSASSNGSIKGSFSFEK